MYISEDIYFDSEINYCSTVVMIGKISVVTRQIGRGGGGVMHFSGLSLSDWLLFSSVTSVYHLIRLPVLDHDGSGKWQDVYMLSMPTPDPNKTALR